MRRTRALGACSVVVLLVAAGLVFAQEAPPAKKKAWKNNAEFSIVATQGNSDTLTLGFKDRYEQALDQKGRNHVRFKFEGTLANKADDRFVVASLTTPPQPIDPLDPCSSAGVSCTTVEPLIEDSVERYLAEGRFDRKLSEKVVWNAGASWDRNLTDGSGVESRSIVFGGLGHIWYDRDDLEFNTNYSLSYTDRVETTPDPEKDDTFAGLRFDLSYSNDLSKSVTYSNSWTVSASLSDSQDFGSDMTNGISVSMSERVALKVSLQWLYNNLPPLETVDLDCANPIPGDPRATIPCNLLCVDAAGLIVNCTIPGAIQLDDETDVHKQSTDLIFNTSLVIKL